MTQQHVGILFAFAAFGLLCYWIGVWAEAVSWREARGRKRSGGKTYAVYETRELFRGDNQ